MVVFPVASSCRLTDVFPVGPVPWEDQIRGGRTYRNESLDHDPSRSSLSTLIGSGGLKVGYVPSPRPVPSQSFPKDTLEPVQNDLFPGPNGVGSITHRE